MQWPALPSWQTLCIRLAVLVNGWSLAAMVAVCWDEELGAPADLAAGAQQQALELVLSLVEKSMILRHTGSSGLRFGMLETLRAYAVDQLATAGETTAVRRRHLAYYRKLAEQIEAELSGPLRGALVAEWEQDHDNIRAALSWAIEQQEGEVALRMVGALWGFWKLLGLLSEGRYWAERALALPLTAPGAARRGSRRSGPPGGWRSASRTTTRPSACCRRATRWPARSRINAAWGGSCRGWGRWCPIRMLGARSPI